MGFMDDGIARFLFYLRVSRLSVSETRSILLVLHSTIFPNMVKGRVVRMTDWLSTLCDRGK